MLRSFAISRLVGFNGGKRFYLRHFSSWRHESGTERHKDVKDSADRNRATGCIEFLRVGNGTGFAQVPFRHSESSYKQLTSEESNMLNRFKDLPTSHVLGWIGVGLLAIAIVLVFVRRLVGMDG